MRVAFVLNHFPVLTETFVLNQITGLLDRGHEIDIYSFAPPNLSKVHPDVERYQLLERTRHWPPKARVPLLSLLQIVPALARNPHAVVPALRALPQLRQGRLRRFTSRVLKASVAAGSEPYDAILCHFGRIGLRALELRQIGALKGKLATVFHGYDMSQYLRQKGENVYDSLLAQGDLFLPISEHWRRRLIELGGAEDQIAVHRMGIDCNRFEFQPRRAATDGVVRILSIARFVEKKGIEYGIRAVAGLIEMGRNVRYLVVGGGPLKQELESLIDSLGVGDRVQLVGWKTQEELVAAIADCHILLSPSVTAADGDQEGIPVALMEAMALGLPVLSTIHSGIPELIADGKTGYLVPERDVTGLTDRLDELAQSPSQWAHMGAAGRAVVEREFNIDRLNDELVELLASM